MNPGHSILSESSALVSVCVPTYNGAEYLQACLDTIVNQTWRNLEIIVVDDASSDATMAILQGYAARDPRFQIHRNDQNLGLVGNWNRCLDLARGEWVKFMFQDDLMQPQCIEKLVALDAEVLAVCGREFLFAPLGPQVRALYEEHALRYDLRQLFPQGSTVSGAAFCDVVLASGVANFVGEPTGVLLRRSAFARFGRFDSRLIQLCDLEYWLRVGVSSGISYVPEHLVSFRVHGQSTTSANQAKRAFANTVLDPLLLRTEMAFGAPYEPLRVVALARGIDLAQRLQQTLVQQMCWGRFWASPEWPAVLARDPRLQLPRWQALKRAVRLAALRLSDRSGAAV